MISADSGNKNLSASIILQVSQSFMAPMKNGHQAHLKPHTSLAVKSGKFGNAIIHGRGKKKSRAKREKKKKGRKEMYECIYTQ